MEEAMVKNPVSKNIMLKKEERESTKNMPPKSFPSGEVKTRTIVKTMPIRATYPRFCFSLFQKKSRTNIKIAQRKRKIWGNRS